MITASGIRAGMVIRLEGDLYQVVGAEYHAGGGQMGGTQLAKVRSLRTGNTKELRLHPAEKIEDVQVEHKEMEFLYSDGTGFYFMDPVNYDQISLPSEAIGRRESFLQPNMRIPVMLCDGNPVSISFPEAVELRVVSSPPGLREHDSSAFKKVVLENGMEILAPQFIKEGEMIRIEVETGKYLERAKRAGKKI